MIQNSAKNKSVFSIKEFQTLSGIILNKDARENNS